ncbi:MAG: serine/threonine protein kinase [Myxococcota bacterium]|jgi:serine/threonine protein kinase
MRALHFLKTLGAGSFGTVYLAELSSEQGFRRRVAVKVIQNSRPDNEMFIARIRDEARLLGLLQDDAILKVLDMVRIDGRDAVVLEYVEGIDLESVVSSGSAPSPRALAELGSAVAGALGRAHKACHPHDQTPLNVIHRDVKPANVMLTRSGGVKLLDFGVARAKFESRESYTGHLMLGTLNYMAPEYIVTNEVSPAADVYGLALSLWEIAAGRPYGQPKVRQNTHEQRLAERLDEIRESHPQLVAVLSSMLQWDPAARPSALEAERQLMEAADQLRGASLRSWAMQVIPPILATREEAPDNANLLGRHVDIGEAARAEEKSSESGGGVGIHEAKTQQIRTRRDSVVRSRPAQSKPVPVPVPIHTKTTPRAKKPQKTRSRPPRRSPDPTRELLLVVVKGLLAGGMVGFLIIVAVGVFLFTR